MFLPSAEVHKINFLPWQKGSNNHPTKTNAKLKKTETKGLPQFKLTMMYGKTHRNHCFFFPGEPNLRAHPYLEDHPS